MRSRFIVLGLLALPPCEGAAEAGIPRESSVDSLGILVRGNSRPFAYTNKESAYFYGETNDANTGSWQGFNVLGHRFLDDYQILVDGKLLDRSAALTTVFPDFLRRAYPGGLVEEVRPADSLPAFFVSLSAEHPVEVVCIPLFSEVRSANDLETVLAKGAVLIARGNHLIRSRSEDYPAWLTVHSDGSTPVMHATKQGRKSSPALLSLGRGRTHLVAFAVGDTREGCERIAEWALLRHRTLWSQRRSRMEDLLHSTAVVSADGRFDKALAWAKLSLDALMMHQGARGIFAGLPWFDNYWGRDTFISLPGAVLVTGRFAEAREILRSFAEFQQRDSLSPDYGRIPNIVTPTDTAYNTADGTPRFVMMMRQYVERSGDEHFGLIMYPTIVRAVEGTLRYHTDSLGFLTHRDAETWMDAVGPDGPWSPRGNRANDVQALWAQQLEASEFFAARVGDVTSARRWNDALVRLRMNFRKYFITAAGIADRLQRDGSADLTLRPNQLFVSPLLSDSERKSMVETVVTRLTYPYGVASLWQGDDNFHPYHQYEPYYPKDAAYHNGTVWTWLQGPLVSELCACTSESLAFALSENSVHQILDRGAIGTQSELLDAIARPGELEPRLSGTFSQAWSLAEFVRNFYDDYFGVRYNGLMRRLTVAPHLIRSFGEVTARLNIEGSGLTIRVKPGPKKEIEISAPEGLLHELKVDVLIHDGRKEHSLGQIVLRAGSQIRFSLEGDSLVARSAQTKRQSTPQRHASFPCFSGPLHFAEPHIRPDLKALKGPDYPLLRHDLVVLDNPNAIVLAKASRPDSGTRIKYSYPRNPNFVPGSFELRQIQVSRDSLNVYFTISMRSLSNPGWHPEYGFQLTFIAIAIDEDGLRASGTLRVGRNAQYTLDAMHGYEKIIFIGGGIRVENAQGNVLASYVPMGEDVSHPLGDASSGRIHFAIPLALIGMPTSDWTFTFLTGGQDDHGGAGIGEFRTVNKERGEWNGGGKVHPDDPNIYDSMVVQVRR